MPDERPEPRIAVHLDRLLEERGVTLTELAQRVGISVVNLSILKNGRARAVRFSTLAALCEARRIDHAWMDEGRRFAELRLVAMDMDTTLITIECIDELGALAGKKAEVAAITEQAMRGEIVDYPESLRRRVALLAGLPESSLSKIYEERLRLTPGAEALIAACKKHGVKLLLVSGGFTFFTERLKARLGIDYTISNTLEVKAGKLTGALVGDIVDAHAKAAKFRSVLSGLGAAKNRSVAIGDGAERCRGQGDELQPRRGDARPALLARRC